MRWTMTRTGQSAAEYAIVLGVVVAALVAMQVYVKRGINAQLKGGVDSFTKAGGPSNPAWITPDGSLTGVVNMSSTRTQYEPYYAQSQYDTLRDSTTAEDTDLKTRKEIIKTIAGASGKETITRKSLGFQKQTTTGTAD